MVDPAMMAMAINMETFIGKYLLVPFSVADFASSTCPIAVEGAFDSCDIVVRALYRPIVSGRARKDTKSRSILVFEVVRITCAVDRSPILNGNVCLCWFEYDWSCFRVVTAAIKMYRKWLAMRMFMQD